MILLDIVKNYRQIWSWDSNCNRDSM